MTLLYSYSFDTASYFASPFPMVQPGTLQAHFPQTEGQLHHTKCHFTQQKIHKPCQTILMDLKLNSHFTTCRHVKLMTGQAHVCLP